MQIDPRTWSERGWSVPRCEATTARARLALVFAPTAMLGDRAIRTELAALYPSARIVGCSTAGEIAGTPS